MAFNVTEIVQLRSCTRAAAWPVLAGITSCQGVFDTRAGRRKKRTWIPCRNEVMSVFGASWRSPITPRRA